MSNKFKFTYLLKKIGIKKLTQQKLLEILAFQSQYNTDSCDSINNYNNNNNSHNELYT